MYLDLGRWITGSALCLSGPLKRLAYSRIDLLWQSAAASVYISREHGRLRTTRNFVWDLCLYHSTINLQLHVHYNWNTPRSSKSLRDSKPPVLGTRGPRDRSHDVSVYETCACVIINLLSYMCISWSSSFIQHCWISNQIRPFQSTLNPPSEISRSPEMCRGMTSTTCATSMCLWPLCMWPLCLLVFCV